MMQSSAPDPESPATANHAASLALWLLLATIAACTTSSQGSSHSLDAGVEDASIGAGDAEGTRDSGALDAPGADVVSPDSAPADHDTGAPSGDTGSPDDGAGDAGGPEGGFVFAPDGGTCGPLGDPCTACAAPTCSAAYCTCYGDHDCAGVLSCLDGCGPLDSSCQDGCYAGHTTGIAEAIALTDCMARQCTSACPGAIPQTNCQECLATMAASDLDQCFADSACVAWFHCFLGCSDTACEANCMADANAESLYSNTQGVCSLYCN